MKSCCYSMQTRTQTDNGRLLYVITMRAIFHEVECFQAASKRVTAQSTYTYVNKHYQTTI